jgi:prepilin-type N-terminal cleavage/methylation domain-containing protein
MRNIKRPHLTNQYGFTLIELVVAFSIMAILATVGIASFVSYSKAQSLQQAVNELSTTINTAKANAAAQTNNKCSGQVLNGYEVVLSDSSSYALYAICNGSENLIKTTSFSQGVHFNMGSYPIKITFSVLSGGVAITPPSANTIVIKGLVMPDRLITIDQGGNIQVK